MISSGTQKVLYLFIVIFGTIISASNSENKTWRDFIANFLVDLPLGLGVVIGGVILLRRRFAKKAGTT